jgi:formate--tetrahydrofolate ligase
VAPGKELDRAYSQKNCELVKKGLANLLAHIEIVKNSGIPLVVCLNHFATDAPEEVKLIQTAVESRGVEFAVSKHWALGGKGAIELAQAVENACRKPSNFKFLYEDQAPLAERIDKIAHNIYGAKEVRYSLGAARKLEQYEKLSQVQDFNVCMVKTHLSLSHDPGQKGRPQDWILPIQDILMYQGAGFIVPVAGEIKLMPGTASSPAFRKIDIDTKTGRVYGLY